eukprot:403321_1
MKDISPRQKDIVNGFIRPVQNTYFVPLEIYYLVCLFYDYEYVLNDSYTVFTDGMILSNEYRTMTNSTGKHCTAYGHIIAGSNHLGIHKWIFTVNKITNKWSLYKQKNKIIVGLDSSDRNCVDFTTGNSSKFYGFDCNGNIYTYYDVPKLSRFEWFAGFGAGDTFAIYYDTVHHILYIRENRMNESEYNHFEIPKNRQYIGVHPSNEYRLAITIHGKNDEITVNSYEFFAEPIQSEKCPTGTQINFKVCVGIDFGTDGCVLAYSFVNWLIHKKKLIDLGTNPEFYTQFKNKTEQTSVLLDGNNTIRAIGGDAEDLFIESPEKIKLYNWKLFKRFKGKLFKGAKGKSRILSDTVSKVNASESNTVKDAIIPTNGGDPYSSKSLFSAVLHKLRDGILNHLQKYDQYKKQDDILWILAVPAICGANERNKIKEWLIEAYESKDPNSIEIVAESTCAALSVQYSCDKWEDIASDEKNFDQHKDIIRVNTNIDPQIRFNSRDICILIDTGVEACNISCYRVIDSYTVENILHPTRSQWGSINIDNQFIDLLTSIFGEHCINNFKQSLCMWLQLKKNFSASKISFYERNYVQYHSIILPTEFAESVYDMVMDNKDFDDDDDDDEDDDEHFDEVQLFLQYKSKELFGENT